MVEQAENADKSAQRDKVIEAVTNLVDIDIPEGMIQAEVDHMLNEFSMQLQQQGLGLDQYFSLTHSTEDDLRNQMSENAKCVLKPI